MIAPAGQLASRVMHFARLLRGAGLPVGTERIALAWHALSLTGLDDRASLREVLAACLIDRAGVRPVFDRAFDLFWPAAHADPPGLPFGPPPAPPLPGPDASEPAPDAPFRVVPEPPAPAPSLRKAGRPAARHAIASSREVLQRADFAALSASDWPAVARLLAGLPLCFERQPGRRRAPARPGPAARLDWRATLRAAGRHGGALWDARWSQRVPRPVPVLMLLDISGSMRAYTRAALHLAHTLARRGPLECFVFGTRLTRITPCLHEREAAAAMARIDAAVPDWSGGTRIGENLHRLQHDWGARMLDGRSTVLLMTDGLETGPPGAADALGEATAGLRRRCRRLLWLNPLLRHDGFAPRAAGMRAILPHVDALMPMHDLQSLQALAATIAVPSPRPDLGS